MANCKAAELADRAVELHALITAADLEFLKVEEDRAKRSAQTQLETYHSDLQKTQSDACRRYAASEKGALFQAIAARDAVSILRSSKMHEAHRLELLTCVDRALDSIEKFFSGRSNQLAALKAMCRARPRRTSYPDLDGIAAKVKAAVAASRTWADLQAALGEHDLEYAPTGGGLFIRVRSTQAYVCKASAAGPGYTPLIRRYGAPFPGHPTSWLAENALGGAARSATKPSE